MQIFIRLKNIFHPIFFKIKLKYFIFLGNYSFFIKKKLIKTNPHHYSFWYKVKKNTWEKNNLLIFEKFISKDDEYLDIGSWIGPTTIQASFFTKNLTCIEADPVNFFYLNDNLKRNNLEKVKLYNFPIVSNTGLVNFKFENDGSSAREINDKENKINYYLNGISWKKFIQEIGYKKFDFIKIDIEGGEYFLILDIKDYIFKFKPTIYCSFHPFIKKDLHNKNIRKIKDIFSIYKYVYNYKFEKIELESYKFDYLNSNKNSLIFSNKKI